MKYSKIMTSLSAASVLFVAACNFPSVNRDNAIASKKLDSSAVPATQMAIVQVGNGGAEVLTYQSIPVLDPAEGHVLIKVAAAAINPIDLRDRTGLARTGGRAGGGGGGMGGAMGAMGAGSMAGSMGGGMGGQGGGGQAGGGGAPQTVDVGSRIPGYDLSGVVVKLGAGVSNIKLGDAVFAKLPPPVSGVLNGAYSEYVVVAIDDVASKPTGHTFAEASGLGTVGTAALRVLDQAGVTAGDRVFINGIGGGVGSSVAQIALARGAYVLGTASSRHHDYLRTIGVTEVINYREAAFDEVIQDPVDVVVETASTESANQALNILKTGGQLVSVVGDADATLCAEKKVVCSRIDENTGRPINELLAEVVQLGEEGKYKLNVDSTFTLEEAAAAQDRNNNIGTTGKLVLIVDPALSNSR